MTSRDIPSRQAPRVRLPASIWALGFVSMFMDISSEMIHGLLPVFLVSALGASTEMVGLIEGIGESTASVSKLFSGWISDRLDNRKALAVIGYGLGALSKPIFALAPTPSWVLVARFSDRIGKGIRGAPRDALVGDLAPAAIRGAAYSLRQSPDTIGAFSGPLLAMGLMAISADDFRLVFWLAVIPGVIAVAILALGVREPKHSEPGKRPRAPIRLADIGRLSWLFWSFVAIGSVLTLARFSEAFLILRAQGVALPLALAPVVLVVMNIVYSATAYPVGVISDRMDRRLMLAAGFVALIAADLVLAFAPGIWFVMLGVAFWGLHMGMTHGLLASLVADATPPQLRGTGFGLFNFASGIAILIGNLIAGVLWDVTGPTDTFLVGAAFSAVALVAIIPLLRRQEGAPH